MELWSEDNLKKKKFGFRVIGLPEDTFAVSAFTGTEGISSLYRFDIELLANDPDIDPGKVVGNVATLTMFNPDGPLHYHGIITRFDQGRNVSDHHFYRATLVPRVWDLSLQKANDIYTDTNVRKIIERELGQAGLTSADYEFLLTADYSADDAQWSQVCQYGEDSLSFISRWMERQGIYYYFRQKNGLEKLVITDHKVHQRALEKKIAYRPVEDVAVDTTEDAIRTFNLKQNILPHKVELTDYNYRRSSYRVEGEAIVSDSGFGTVQIHGENIRNNDLANDIATIRAEEILCRGATFYGTSGSQLLRSGFYFDLAGHYRDSFNSRYLVTSIEHEGSQSGLFILGASADEAPFYRNSFTAIQGDRQFRPERKTPKPRIHGSMNAKIDCANDSSGEYADPDEYGRYKIRLPFGSERQGGKNSRWVRMATPSTGDKGQGIHFPLRKDTDVLLNFIDGDPDQPVITGAVPSSINPSVVNAGNATMTQMRTAGGSFMEMDDKDGAQRVKLFTPTSGSYFHIGAPHNPTAELELSTAGNARMRAHAEYRMDVGPTAAGATGAGVTYSSGALDMNIDNKLNLATSAVVTLSDSYDMRTKSHLTAAAHKSLKLESEDTIKIQVGNASVRALDITAVTGVGDAFALTAELAAEGMGLGNIGIGNDTSSKYSDQLTGDDHTPMAGGIAISAEGTIDVIADKIGMTTNGSDDTNWGDYFEMTKGQSDQIMIGATTDVMLGGTSSVNVEVEGQLTLGLAIELAVGGYLKGKVGLGLAYASASHSTGVGKFRVNVLETKIHAIKGSMNPAVVETYGADLEFYGAIKWEV